MKESSFWAYIAPKLRGKWQRIESPITHGLPDCFVIVDGVEMWCELKYRKVFDLGLDVRPAQRFWHNDYWQRGGTSFLLARVSKKLLLVCGNQLELRAGDEYWLNNALLVQTVGKDVCGDAIVDAMLTVARARRA